MDTNAYRKVTQSRNRHELSTPEMWKAGKIILPQENSAEQKSELVEPFFSLLFIRICHLSEFIKDKGNLHQVIKNMVGVIRFLYQRLKKRKIRLSDSLRLYQKSQKSIHLRVDIFPSPGAIPFAER